MYADRLQEDSTSRRSVVDRLNGTSAVDSTRRRQVTGKRERQDDKWEHDLYEDGELQRRHSNVKVGTQDLRFKLQKKNQPQVSQSGSSRSGVRDLREKLSGTMNPPPVKANPPRLEAAKAIMKSVAVEIPKREAKEVVNPSQRKKSQAKSDTPVDDFLRSLGLEKYSIPFQVEEVDMTALLHMTDDDLKAMGIPMGPRKKILLALESAS